MKAILALEDGTVFTGESFTGPGEATGEVIFHTAMSGYQEILTDPAQYGQMVCMTYPLIGNYGVNPEDAESARVHCPALIVKECCREPSSWRSTESLPDYLKRHGVMGLEGVDTRALTRHLRIHGAMRGVISTEEGPEALAAKARALPSMEGARLADFTAPKEPYHWTDQGPRPAAPQWPEDSGDRPKVLVYDYGTRWSALRQLAAEGLAILAVPPDFPAQSVRKLAPHGVFLSSGPGDPAAMSEAVSIVRELCEICPVSGIGLGYQLLGLALGGSSYKLRFGHHGANHPVRDDISGTIEISSQSHGFCLDISGLDELEQTHLNLNDGTPGGFRHRTKPLFGVQHYPGTNPPPGGRSFFTEFRHMLEERAR
ncbi:MAG: glutamine-hydrolyzing carbamoyl-phosphate synthase small subunit [Pseudomonadota bacterium]|nr:glutamine-hydrolyzing carbamoyl-phosphate synthase small subunit [Pseudomonadota bacterium]